ncbi:MAG: phosphotransferase [Anaerolineales bacterium]|nr:phosphotransferase [Anaerolineales bacterium]
MTVPEDQNQTTNFQAILNTVAPGATFVALRPLEGDFSNTTQLIEATAADGAPLRLVSRRYAIFGDYDRGEKARREFQTLQLLSRHNVPAPEPIFLDDTGATLGSPGIVTGFVPGKLLLDPPYPADRPERLAQTLAAIHRIPIGPSAAFLLDANREVTWFLNKPDVMPEYISVHPLGPAIWDATRNYWSTMTPAAPGLVHIDYWGGNVLWHEGAIAAVVDWEEAAQGDPGIDVAYCRLDMVLCGLPDQAERFLASYEAATGEPARHLAFWELVAAVRPLFNPEGWISDSPQKERFAAFVESALARLSDA